MKSNSSELDGLLSIYNDNVLVISRKNNEEFSSNTLITIPNWNQIVPTCDLPSSNIYNSLGYQSRINASQSQGGLSSYIPSICLIQLYNNTVNYVTNWSYFDEFNGIGAGCSELEECSGHGVCDYCNNRCICDAGYDADTSFTTTCKQSKYAI